MAAGVARKKPLGSELPDREWLTPNESARALGIARGTLFARIASGRLHLTVDQRGDLTFISRASVERVLNET
jgi:predicted site-specific integrase-resolvase